MQTPELGLRRLAGPGVIAVGLIVVVGVLTLAGCGGGAAPAGVDAQLASQGKSLAAQYGCVACHSTDGSKMTGPTWKGLYGSQVKLVGGQSVTADDAYLSESITSSDAKIVEGYTPGSMAPAVAPFLAQIRQGNNLAALVEYVKSVR